MQGRYIWVIDSAHAWLRVPESDVSELGFEPSSCSYTNNGDIYLDIDVDSNRFLRAYVHRYYTRPALTKQIVDYPAYCREFPQYKRD